MSGVPIPRIQWHSEDFPVIPTQNIYQQVFVVPTDSPHTTTYTCVGAPPNYYKISEVRVNVTVIVEGK